MPLTPLFFRFNAVNAAIFPVQRRYRRYFSGSPPLLPLFFGSTPLTPVAFRLNAVNAANFPVERRKGRHFSGSTPLRRLLF